MEEKNRIIEKLPEMPKGLIRIDGTAKNSIRKELTEKELKKMRDADRELVTGRFRFYESRGGTIKFSVRFYKEDPVETWEMKDGEVYTISMGVAKHLETSGWYPVRRDKQHKNAGIELELGNKEERYRVIEKVQRYGFTPIGFNEDWSKDIRPANIVTVEKF